MELLAKAVLVGGQPGVAPLLACGHRGLVVAPDSSVLRHPMEAVWCPHCVDYRYLAVELQSALMAHRDIAA